MMPGTIERVMKSLNLLGLISPRRIIWKETQVANPREVKAVNEKAERVLEIMESHETELCQNRYTLRSGQGEFHCLLGWMGIEAGIQPPAGVLNTEVIGRPGTLGFAAALQSEYGVSLAELKAIQATNDDSATQSDRRVRVRSILLSSDYASKECRDALDEEWRFAVSTGCAGTRSASRV